MPIKRQTKNGVWSPVSSTCRNYAHLSLFLISGILSFVFLPFLSSNALADFRVCNATQKKAGVAIGYRAKTGWISEGWWQVEPTSCATVIDGELSSRFYYLYAEDVEGLVKWDGDVNMCVSENEFRIDGVSNCFPRGFQRFGFREIDTKNQSNWMVQLTDTPTANTDNRENSGNADNSAGQTNAAPSGQ